MVRIYSRLNGWSLPPNPLQIFAWVIIVYLATLVYVVLIPVLRVHAVKVALYAVMIVLRRLT
ncbi:unnamed protein product [Soboliphyme baturini]|uniref:YggT family protein n=1 Tax=Soboliphyme baturini TaxID=241478 RepID=A0A183IAI5_9BILA|nr:unnamed protein product [Soboliphyme baturini]